MSVTTAAKLVGDGCVPTDVFVDDDGALGLTQTRKGHIDYVLLGREQMEQLHALLSELLQAKR